MNYFYLVTFVLYLKLVHALRSPVHFRHILEEVVKPYIKLHITVLGFQCLADINRDNKVFIHGELKTKTCCYMG